MLVQLTVCLIASMSLLNQHSRRIQDIYSSIEQIRLRWLRNLLLFTAVLFLVQVAQAFVLDPLDINAPLIDPILGISVVVLIYTLGWMGLRQAAIFSEVNTPAVQSPAKGDDLASDSKYARSALSPEGSDSIVAELRSLMDSERLYLQSGLSIHDLSERMSVSTNYLSQAINQTTNDNFFEFVNAYRVEHAATALRNSSTSVLEIAMNAGFNSKSAFYTAFKRHKSMTPSEYRTHAP